MNALPKLDDTVEPKHCESTWTGEAHGKRSTGEREDRSEVAGDASMDSY